MWEEATFTVPFGVTEERVKDAIPKYIKKWMEVREAQDWKLFSRIFFNPIPRIEGDRKRYSLWASLDREPKPKTIEVPDNPKLIKRLERKYGARLQD